MKISNFLLLNDIVILKIMFGIIFVALGQLFAEGGISLGKYEMSQKKESIYAFGFLNAIWATIFLLIIGIFIRDNFIFTLAGLPTFIARAVLEIILVFVSLKAIAKAERSTFAFIHTTTIPLLLVVDIFLGYTFSIQQLVGISAIVLALIFLFLNHGLSREGKLYSLIASILAVGTIALYKYNITHFNSVEAEQGLMLILIVTTFVVVAWIQNRENLFKYLVEPKFFVQSVLSGFSHVFISFAYIFFQASIITTAKRSFEILFSVISGRSYFHEKHILIKIFASTFIIFGLVLIIL